MKILLIEDDGRIAGFIMKGLREEAFTVDHVSSGEEGVQLAEHSTYDLIVLDIMLPGINGFEVCKEIRKKGIHTPVIMLTAKITVKDKVSGLEAGADDYITKPFSFEEFLARVRAVLRRRDYRIIAMQYGDLTVDATSHRVFFKDEEIYLRPKEFAMLQYLIRNRGRVLTRTQILESIWGYDHDPNTNVVDVYIRHLREKLTPYFQDNIIRTVRGTGYMIVDR